MVLSGLRERDAPWIVTLATQGHAAALTHRSRRGTADFIGEVEVQLVGEEPSWSLVTVTKADGAALRSADALGADGALLEAGSPSSQALVLRCRLREREIEDTEGSEWTSRGLGWGSDDGSVLLLHLLAFSSAHAPAITDHSMAGLVDTGREVRRAGWFDVVETVFGDGRTWDQVRINHYPSFEVFESVVLDPDRLAHMETLGDQGIVDSYTLVLRPVLGRSDHSRPDG